MKNNPLLIRVDESKKIDFKIFLLRHQVSMQDMMETLIDSLVRFDKGSKEPFIEKLIKEAQK